MLNNPLYSFGGLALDQWQWTDKDDMRLQLVGEMVTRLLAMFEWRGLPDTVPAQYLERALLTVGVAAVAPVDGELRALVGNWGGKLDGYYMPRYIIVNNPWLSYNATLEVDVDCALVRNTPLWLSAMPALTRYASALVESWLTLRRANINDRTLVHISAPDDRTHEAALDYLWKIEEGEPGVIASNAFLEGVAVSPNGTGASRLSSDVEYHQYLKAGFFNHFGLDSNYNMKREAINADESQLNDDMLRPLVDVMLECRQEDAGKINRMYGTDITVELASAWGENEREREAELEQMEEVNDDEETPASEGD